MAAKERKEADDNKNGPQNDVGGVSDRAAQPPRENKKSIPPKAKALTEQDLQQFKVEMAQQFDNAIRTLTTEFGEATKKIVSEHVAGVNQRIDEVVEHSNKLTEVVNALSNVKGPGEQRIPAAQPENGGGAANNKLAELGINPGEIAPQLIDRLMAKYFGTPQDSVDPAVYEFKRNTERLNQQVYKIAAKITGKILETSLKQAARQGDFLHTEAAELVRENVGADHHGLT